MPTLKGARVALLEARMSDELGSLVERLGGKPYRVPSVREESIDHPDEVRAFLDSLCSRRFKVVVLLTGVGVKALLREAERVGRADEVVAALRNTTTVCRGPKPAAVLRQYQIPVGVAVPEPHTTHELLGALKPFDLRNSPVALLHYGERNDVLAAELRARGAVLDEICLYEWRLPEDLTPLKTLVGEIVGGRVDAVAFTSQIQVRHLFMVADEIGKASALANALNDDATVVVAIGPVCASALRAVGVIPRVQPSHPKMGPMVLALADYFELSGR